MDLDLGPFVLGGNVFGWTVEPPDSFRLLDAFVERGGRAIDTADVYPAWADGRQGGESEQRIGDWLKQRGRREDVIVATKVAKWAEQPGLSPANIRSAVEGSLRRLQTDYIDLYYAHEDDEAVPQPQYLAAFDALVREGKVRALGASNFRASRLGSALDIAASEGLTPFSHSQDQWSLLERDVETQLAPLLEARGLREVPYWALAAGFLTGKYRPGNAVDSARLGMVEKYLDDAKSLRLLERLDEVAEAHDCAVASVSLAWLRAQKTVAAPLASARTLEQLDTLFESATLTLTTDELDSLGAITAPQS